jgi:phosphoribosyl 1,2-cyclic phosphodiesterase
MFIRFWGARGSLAVSGRRYLKYGGNTTCVEIRSSDGKLIVVDAGTGIRELGNRLIKEEVHEFTMLFTHAHWDHILGFPFFRPIYSPRTKIEVFGCSASQKSVKDILHGTMESPNFPVDFGGIRSSISFNGVCPCNTRVGTIEISTIPLTHPDKGHGYCFTENGKSFVFLTDNELNHPHEDGLPYDEYVKFSHGADLLVHDAEYRPEEYTLTRGWGHTVFTDALKLALDAGAKRFGIFHHNVEHSDDDIDLMVEECRATVRDEGKSLECFAVAQESEFTL